MMQAADAGYSHALGGPAGPAFDHPGVRRLLLQGIVNAIVVVILEIISNQPAEMGFVEDDHVVQQFPPTTSHPTLRHAVLPGTAISCSDSSLGRFSSIVATSPLNLTSRSRIRYWGARSSAKASRRCCTIQAQEGCSVTLKCRMLRRPWLITKKHYSIRKVAVGTVKKSMAAMASRWFLRKVSQRW